MHATVRHWSRRVTKRLTVEDGPIHAEGGLLMIKVDAIGLDYTDNGSGMSVKATLYGPVLREDGAYSRRRIHTVRNALAEGGWLRELIDEHTPPEFLPNTPKP